MIQFTIDGSLLAGLAVLLAAVAQVIWACRRDPRGPRNRRDN
jgi:hypothetical protein